jgi:hypothetical protein
MDTKKLGGLIAVDEWGGSRAKYWDINLLGNGRLAQLGHGASPPRESNGLPSFSYRLPTWHFCGDKH